MTRRAFAALVACLPLSWQRRLVAAPPTPALTMAFVTSHKLAIFEPHRMWMGEFASPRHLPSMLREFSRLAGHDADAVARAYLPRLLRDLEQLTGQVIEHAVFLPARSR